MASHAAGTPRPGGALPAPPRAWAHLCVVRFVREEYSRVVRGAEETEALLRAAPALRPLLAHDARGTPSLRLSRALMPDAARALLRAGMALQEWERGGTQRWTLRCSARPGDLEALGVDLQAALSPADKGVMAALDTHRDADGARIALVWLDTLEREIAVAEVRQGSEASGSEHVIECLLRECSAKEVLLPDTRDDDNDRVVAGHSVPDLAAAVARVGGVQVPAVCEEAGRDTGAPTGADTARHDSQMPSAAKLTVLTDLLDEIVADDCRDALDDIVRRPATMCALYRLVTHLDLYSRACSPAYTLRVVSPGTSLRYDSSVEAALSVFPAPHEDAAPAALLSVPSSSSSPPQHPGEDRNASASSVMELVGHTRTPMGRRLLRDWLCKPSTVPGLIEERHDCVDWLVTHPIVRTELRASTDCLKGCSDLVRLTSKFVRQQRFFDDAAAAVENKSKKSRPDIEQQQQQQQQLQQNQLDGDTAEDGMASNGSAPTLRDLLELYRAVRRVDSIRQVLQLEAAGQSSTPGSDAVVQRKFTVPIEELHTSLQQYGALVEELVDADEMQRTRGWQMRVRPAFSPVLQALSIERTQAHRDMQDERNRAVRALKLKDSERLKLEHTHVHGWHFRVSKRDHTLLRKAADSGFEHTQLSVQKAGALFTTPALERAVTTERSLESQFLHAQARIVAQAVQVACTYTSLFSRAAACIAELDVLASFAEAAAVYDWCRPRLCVEQDGCDVTHAAREVKLEQLRHPCVEAAIGSNFVANDVHMCAADKNTMLITGPNCGGKSTLLRSVGIAVLLCQTGSFVPATSATLPVFDRLLARVGATDHQIRGVSTFMAEMLSVSDILQEATPHSLVLVDELGRGTSTFDGYGIASAVTKHLSTHIGCLTLFATHFHELTALEQDDDTPGVFNMHVTAAAGVRASSSSSSSSSSELVMLYKLRPGPCDRSFGIHVARMALFPAEIVADAEAMSRQWEDTT